MHKNKTNYIITLGLLSITILSSIALSSTLTFATDNTDIVDQVNITVPISCSIEGTGMTSHNASIPNGTYQADIGSTTLKAFCNDSEGFAIYATGYTGNEIGTEDSNKLVGTNGNIITGTATSGDTSNWAMKLSTITSPTPTYPITITSDTEGLFTNYHTIPNEYTKVATRLAGTDIGTNAEGSTLTTTYAAYMSKTQAAGTYSGQVIYTLVHPSNASAPFIPHEVTCESGKICYNTNADIIDTMANQTIEASDTETMLWPSNFQRHGYGFAGWSETYDYSDTTKIHGPMETITFNAGEYDGEEGTNNGLSLYAYWVQSAGNLQDFTTQQCTAMTSGQITALTDTRDDNTYAIAKLADGKCWMIENLRLADKDSNNNDIELSNTNTNNPSLPITNDSLYHTASNHLSAPTDPIQSGWCGTVSWCIDQSMLSTNNTAGASTTADSMTTSINTDVYSYGNYYNWYSATAGNGLYYTDSDVTVVGDICPTNWRLPTGGYNATNDFAVLDSAIRGANASAGSIEATKLWRSYPNNLLPSGSINNTNISRDTLSGNYWSSTSSSNSNAYTASFYYGYFYTSGWNASKNVGANVRCVFNSQ